MFVTFVMDPLIKEYKKFFTKENGESVLMQNTNAEYREAKMKVKNQLSKSMPVEKGILSMVV